MVLYLLLIALIAGERVVELVLSRRHTAWALARGGREYGRDHFPAMTLLHTVFLLAAPLEVVLGGRGFYSAIGWPALGLVVGAQMLRYWAIATLGRRWNVRVIVLPGWSVVDRGPYRWLKHPNYVAVMVEGMALPMVHSAYLTALGFTVLNIFLLRVRIRAEEEALREHCDYDSRLGDRCGLFPGR